MIATVTTLEIEEGDRIVSGPFDNYRGCLVVGVSERSFGPGGRYLALQYDGAAMCEENGFAPWERWVIERVATGGTDE